MRAVASILTMPHARFAGILAAFEVIPVAKRATDAVIQRISQRIDPSKPFNLPQILMTGGRARLPVNGPACANTLNFLELF